MGKDSRIAWCHHTANYWMGCTKISPACDNCYAESWAKRTGQPQLWEGNVRRTSDIKWRENMKYRHMPGPEGGRPRIFVNSLSDTFDNRVPAHWREEMWREIKHCVEGDYLILTKRPQNILKMLPPDWGDGYPNVWMGVTVENRAEMMRRAPLLKAVPAALRFWSAEPLLEDLGVVPVELLPDWVIAGGESCPRFRAMESAWARHLRDQCADAGVPFFMKQMSGPHQSRMPSIPEDLMVRQLPEAVMA